MKLKMKPLTIVGCGSILAIILGLVLFECIGSKDQKTIKNKTKETLLFAEISFEDSDGLIEEWVAYEEFRSDINKEDLQTILELAEKSETNNLAEQIPSSIYNGGLFILDENSRPFAAIILLDARPYMRISREITKYDKGFQTDLKFDENMIYTRDEKLYALVEEWKNRCGFQANLEKNLKRRGGIL
jgi:hypothetical protein